MADVLSSGGMMYVNKRKRIVVIALIVFSSFLTSLFFQNCSPIQSQADLPSSDGGNGASSVPNPGALPAGCTGAQPADTETLLNACPSGQTGTGVFSVVAHPCIGTTYGNAAPITITRCTATTSTPPPALTAAERGGICDNYIEGVTPTLSNSILETSMNSGLGDGTTRTGNGDSSTAPIQATVTANIGAGSQNILPPFPGITGARSDAELDCQYTTRVICEVVPAESTVTKAINKNITSNNYGLNEAAIVNNMSAGTAKDAAFSTLVNNVFSTARNGNGDSCEFDIMNATSGSRSQTYDLNLIRNENGYLCVQASIRVRMSVFTTTPGSTVQSNTSSFSYYTVTVNNTCWDENRLVPNPAALPTTANYGAVVTASDKWLVALSPSDNNGSTTQIGSVSIFDKNNLSLTPVKLYLPGLTGGGSTGDSTVTAAISGDWLAVSAINRSTYKGSVFFYVYENSNWVLKTTLSRPAGDKASFGYALALNSNGLLAVGAPHYSQADTTSSTGDLAGRVFLFSCGASGCSPTSIGFIQNVNVGAFFGAALSLDNNRLAVGAPYVPAQSDIHGDGFVRVFDISGGTATQVGELIAPGNSTISTGPSDPRIANPVASGGIARGRGFGHSVSVKGSKLIVGAPYKSMLNGSTFSAKTGEAYFYPNLATSTGMVTLNLNGAAADSRYGQGVALNSKGAFTGCPYCQTNLGQIYYHQYDGNNSINAASSRTTFPLDRINRDGFGNSVFATDLDVVVGASNRTVGSNSTAGAAYRYAAP